MVETFYLGEDTMQTDAIIAICDRLRVERSMAYKRRAKALEHLSALLYGR